MPMFNVGLSRPNAVQFAIFILCIAFQLKNSKPEKDNNNLIYIRLHNQLINFASAEVPRRLNVITISENVIGLLTPGRGRFRHWIGVVGKLAASRVS